MGIPTPLLRLMSFVPTAAEGAVFTIAFDEALSPVLERRIVVDPASQKLAYVGGFPLPLSHVRDQRFLLLLTNLLGIVFERRSAAWGVFR